MNWCDNWKDRLGQLKSWRGGCLKQMQFSSLILQAPSVRRFSAGGILHLGARWICSLLLVAALPLQADAKTKSKSKKPKDASGAKQQFEVPIPIGHDAMGIRIPVYDLAGKLQMYFNSEIAFRVDQGHLRLNNLKIETYDDAGKPDMIIDLPKSEFDLTSRVLSSEDPVTIHRTDFEVTGAHMTFDTQTRQGKFTGPVRMLIFNSDDLNKETGEKTPGEESK